MTFRVKYGKIILEFLEGCVAYVSFDCGRRQAC